MSKRRSEWKKAKPVYPICANVPVSPKTIEWLQSIRELDAAYLAQAGNLHGAVPDKQYFEAANGQTYRVGRFLTLVDDDSELDENPDWRSWEYGEDARIDWSVSMLKDGDAPIPRGLGESIVPFAALYSGDVHPDRLGTGEYGNVDLLCFLYGIENERPAIVVWEGAKAPMDYTDEEEIEYSDFTIPVAATFDQFMSCLREQPS